MQQISSADHTQMHTQMSVAVISNQCATAQKNTFGAAQVCRETLIRARIYLYGKEDYLAFSDFPDSWPKAQYVLVISLTESTQS